MFSLSNSVLEAILILFSLVLPKGHSIPDTLDKVRKVVRDLGLDYEKIHACVNDCVLFRRNYSRTDKYPMCGESRWKNDEEATGTASTKTHYPHKTLRYFPIIPQLQILYMRDTTSSLMRWHKRDEIVGDGQMCHLADSIAWKHVDKLYLEFVSDPHNVRLRIAFDSFNPCNSVC
jgi:hypothetical protein